MRQALEREPLGRQRILLVPEHMTYAAERALAKTLTHSAGFLQAYVFGFRRLARQVLLETGGAHLPRISDIGRRILLKDILLKHKKELSVFARSVGKRGFTETLGHTMPNSSATDLVLRFCAMPQRTMNICRSAFLKS